MFADLSLSVGDRWIHFYPKAEQYLCDKDN